MAKSRKPISKRVRFEVLRAHNFACLYCGTPSGVSQIEIDHVIPYSLGGTDDPWNLAPACVDCNAGKLDTAPSAEMVAAARAAFLAIAGREYVGCTVCGVPIRPDPEDDAADPSPQCPACNAAIVKAFDAGVSWAEGR